MSSKHTFQAEVQQLLKLMIHSLYKNREVFLRELIANAADALSKRHFAAIGNPELLGTQDELRIRISSASNLITIEDNGIGMTDSEVHENIGTIAYSDTLEFLRKHKDQTDLIGQFGVGFYSVFMVADKVTLETLKAGCDPQKGCRWQSDGCSDYSVESLTVPSCGTRITIQLKQDAQRFADPSVLKGLVLEYSNHVGWPIEMLTDPDSKSKVWQIVNDRKPIWKREPKQVSQDEHVAFYQELSADYSEPAGIVHNHVEGSISYSLLIYIKNHSSLVTQNREHMRGLKLYVRSMYVSDVSKEFLPAWLRFCTGIIDSPDLPLNVSREFIQSSSTTRLIRTSLIRRILKCLSKLSSDDPKSYLSFWQQHGNVLKEGAVEDSEHRKEISDLLRFPTSQHQEGRSLAQILADTKGDSKEIFYIAAENMKTALGSVHLRHYQKENIEVLLLCDPIDEWVINALDSYQEHKFHPINREIKSDQPETSVFTPERERLAPLLLALKEQLKEHVIQVRISDRLAGFPCCLIADANDPGLNLRRILHASGQSLPEQKLIMEINPDHPIIKNLDASDAHFSDWATSLYDLALLSEGGKLEDPGQSVTRLTKLLCTSFEAGSTPKIQML